jgi:hypothetical protein
MKINTCFKRALIFLIAINIISHEVICEKMQTIASFKSNYKLMKAHNKQVKSVTTPTANSQPEESASSLIKKAGEDLPDVPIYFQGWVKYFRYAENGQERPKKFFKNTAYGKQLQAASADASKEEKDQVKLQFIYIFTYYYIFKFLNSTALKKFHQKNTFFLLFTKIQLTFLHQEKTL